MKFCGKQLIGLSGFNRSRLFILNCILTDRGSNHCVPVIMNRITLTPIGLNSFPLAGKKVTSSRDRIELAVDGSLKLSESTS